MEEQKKQTRDREDYKAKINKNRGASKRSGTGDVDDSRSGDDAWTEDERRRKGDGRIQERAKRPHTNACHGCQSSSTLHAHGHLLPRRW